MSLSTTQRIGAAALVVAATCAVAFVVATDRLGNGREADDAPTGAVVLTETTGVQVVPEATPAQAAMAVSSRLFDRSEVAVLTSDDDSAQTSAVATADRLGVPVLLDDPAAPAELARLRTRTVLSFGEVTSVADATPIEGDEAAQEAAVTQAIGTFEKPAAPKRPGVVLVGSAEDYAVAVAAARAAGATVIESEDGDVRRDDAVAAALAKVADRGVIAIGEPFTQDLGYAIAAAQASAAQPDGSLLALPGHTYVALRGVPGDDDSGPLGERGVDGGLKLLDQVSAAHAKGAEGAGGSGEVVPALEVLTAGQSAKDLTAIVDSAAKADAVVLLTLEPGDESWVEQAQSLAKLLARPNVGLSIDPGADGTSADEVNEVGTWLADLVRDDTLAQKLFVVHTGQDRALDVGDLSASRPEIATIVQVDTIGTTQVKLAVWDAVTADVPRGAALGWAQDSQGDRPMLSIGALWGSVDPAPSLVLYR